MNPKTEKKIAYSILVIFLIAVACLGIAWIAGNNCSSTTIYFDAVNNGVSIGGIPFYMWDSSSILAVNNSTNTYQNHNQIKSGMCDEEYTIQIIANHHWLTNTIYVFGGNVGIDMNTTSGAITEYQIQSPPK